MGLCLSTTVSVSSFLLALAAGMPSAHGGICTSDMDCKGVRICERERCVYPRVAATSKRARTAAATPTRYRPRSPDASDGRAVRIAEPPAPIASNPSTAAYAPAIAQPAAAPLAPPPAYWVPPAPGYAPPMFPQPDAGLAQSDAYAKQHWYGFYVSGAMMIIPYSRTNLYGHNSEAITALGSRVAPYLAIMHASERNLFHIGAALNMITVVDSEDHGAKDYSLALVLKLGRPLSERWRIGFGLDLGIAAHLEELEKQYSDGTDTVVFLGPYAYPRMDLDFAIYRSAPFSLAAFVSSGVATMPCMGQVNDGDGLRNEWSWTFRITNLIGLNIGIE